MHAVNRGHYKINSVDNVRMESTWVAEDAYKYKCCTHFQFLIQFRFVVNRLDWLSSPFTKITIIQDFRSGEGESVRTLQITDMNQRKIILAIKVQAHHCRLYALHLHCSMLVTFCAHYAG